MNGETVRAPLWAKEGWVFHCWDISDITTYPEDQLILAPQNKTSPKYFYIPKNIELNLPRRATNLELTASVKLDQKVQKSEMSTCSGEALSVITQAGCGFIQGL